MSGETWTSQLVSSCSREDILVCEVKAVAPAPRAQNWGARFDSDYNLEEILNVRWPGRCVRQKSELCTSRTTIIFVEEGPRVTLSRVARAEGFQSWMWRNLSFVLPFLVVGYFFQLYNSYELARLAMDEKTVEWQVRGVRNFSECHKTNNQAKTF